VVGRHPSSEQITKGEERCRASQRPVLSELSSELTSSLFGIR
jgi:hypothetical protein